MNTLKKALLSAQVKTKWNVAFRTLCTCQSPPPERVTRWVETFQHLENASWETNVFDSLWQYYD